MWKTSKLDEMTSLPASEFKLLVGCTGTNCGRFAQLPLPHKIGANMRKGWTSYFEELKQQGFVMTVTGVSGGQPSLHVVLCMTCASAAGLIPGAGSDLPPAES